jgi:hypothetical protein
MDSCSKHIEWSLLHQKRGSFMQLRSRASPLSKLHPHNIVTSPHHRVPNTATSTPGKLQTVSLCFHSPTLSARYAGQRALFQRRLEDRTDTCCHWPGLMCLVMGTDFLLELSHRCLTA